LECVGWLVIYIFLDLIDAWKMEHIKIIITCIC